MIPDMTDRELAWLVVIAIAGIAMFFAAMFFAGWAIIRAIARFERWHRGRRIHRAQLELSVTRRHVGQDEYLRAEREIARRDIARRQAEKTRS